MSDHDGNAKVYAVKDGSIWEGCRVIGNLNSTVINIEGQLSHGAIANNTIELVDDQGTLDEIAPVVTEPSNR